LRAAGAGPEIGEARRPVVLTPDGGGRVLVFSCGMESSGVPASWAATAGRSGVDLVPESERTGAAEIAGRVRRAKGPGDLVVVSLHWGSNWGYYVPPAQRRFAHALVDAGVDVVHGHSSHHPRPLEVYRDRLVLYGCGDLIDDYEGITGYERYRDDLRLLYLASLDADTGGLLGLTMVPMRACRLRLDRAGDQDAEWLRAVLDEESHPFGTAVARTPDGALTLGPR
jgi:poly-gamma-glutamate capsule biosynthesis protein CapA/YwtB (metallophosphatase superfamily)